MKLIWLTVFLLFLYSQITFCNNGDDSVKVNFNGIGSLNMTDDAIMGVAKGARMILNDSTDQGIEIVYAVIRMQINQDSINRTFDYKTMEMVSFLADLVNNSVNKEEHEFGIRFFNSMVKRDSKKTMALIKKYVSNYPRSVFIRRIELFITSFSEDYEKVSNRITYLLQLDSTLIGANTLKADILYDHGSYHESEQYYSRAIRIFPEYAYAYNCRGMCLYKQKHFEEAIVDLEKAIKRYPKLIYAYYNKGNVLQSQKKYEQSLVEFRKCLAINPDYFWAIREMGYSFDNMNKADSALHYYSKAIYKNPTNAWCIDSRGDFYYDHENYELAIKDYSTALQYDYYNIYYYADRGDAFDAAEMPEEAMNDFNRALEISPEYDYALKRIGDLYYKKGEYQKSIDYCIKAIAIDPLYKYAYVRMAFGYEGLGDRQSQINALAKAVSIDTTFSNALGNLGWAYYCTDQYDSCIYYSHRAIRYDNSAYYAMFNIALATLRLGRYEEAKALYRKYHDIYTKSETDELDGAIQDLKDLLDKNILREEAAYILKSIFNYEI